MRATVLRRPMETMRAQLMDSRTRTVDGYTDVDAGRWRRHPGDGQEQHPGG
jgi:hypothetical protein